MYKRQLLIRPGKAVVLGTVPFWDAERQELRNRAPVLVEDRMLYQDKLHLTPWESEFSPGTELRVWEFAGLRFAVVICLDIEIPEDVYKRQIMRRHSSPSPPPPHEPGHV